MLKKLTKHGNSLALVIDRPILELLKIDPDTPLNVLRDAAALESAVATPQATFGGEFPGAKIAKSFGIRV